MKTIFHHPPEPAGGKKYWRSLEELSETPEFRSLLEREFPRGAAEFNDEDGLSRRSFLKLMGASTALAGLGLSGCHRPVMHLVPFTKSVEWAIPGAPLFYATSMPGRRCALPLVVTTYDGRPTKVDGNPLHPVTKGASDVFAQASILNLYDPDRSRYFLENGEQADAARFNLSLDKIRGNLAANGGAGIAFLVEQDNSPTRERLRGEVLKKFPQATWCVYEPLGNDDAARILEAGGTRLSPQIDKADVILALDCDFLGCDDGGVEASRAFAARRQPDQPAGGRMNRLYVVENRYTLTGGVADHRLRCPASQIAAFALALAKEIAKRTTGNAALDPFDGGIAKPQVNASFVEGWVERTAEDLIDARGRGLVMAGPRQPAAVHLLVQSINKALGNLGSTVMGMPVTENPGVTIGELARDIADKKVNTLFILGGNPVYNAPSDLEWEKLQKSIPVVVRVGIYVDETSAGCSWHVPAAHYLEAWGDGRASDGSYLSGQPMILPLFDGWSDLDILARLAGLPKPAGSELVRETFRSIAKAADFDAEWNKFLHDGFLEGSAVAATAPQAVAAPAGYVRDNLNLTSMTGEDAYEVVFTSSASVDDGRYANNSWLQELPDPITKLTWDNAALISPATAKKLGITPKTFGQKDFPVIEVALENRKIEIAALVAPGHADHSVSIPLGYGRTATGWVGANAGVDVYPLRTSATPYFAAGATIRLTGNVHSLAITQDHNNMEGRALVREATLDQYQKNPEFAKTMWMDADLPATNPTLYSHPPMTGLNQWGMVIDLNKCTGCNACVVACQAENNIPIVGKEQVINGREMHWIRNDRYFASWDKQDDDPEMVMEPMLCQQCENAPCETVCPVNATVHSEEGLNVMAYNRCIGTRYCSNNCPFKVRRFNFFDYQQRPVAPQKVPLFGEVSGLKLGPLTEKGSPDTLKMQKNPNVTVRMRGIMEKCTFCVQRIETAKIAQRVKAGPSPDVRVPADAFQVACQQACPAEAIVFGDILEDSGSKVSKLRKDPRGYTLLAYLNVNSRITYLAKIRNPNMKMPGADKIAEFDAAQQEKKPKGAP